MSTENTAQLEDAELLALDKSIPWEELGKKTIFITGATGLIGKAIVKALLHYDAAHGGNIHIIALARNAENAQKLYAECPGVEYLSFLEGDIKSFPMPSDSIDYVIHGAAPTGSQYFIDHPIDTINDIIAGTQHVLNMAFEKRVRGMVYLSSMEVYGKIEHENKLREPDLGEIDLTSSRSSYPEGKRAAELLCNCYMKQKQVPVTNVRLAQTFGPGINIEKDQRVFAYMARCIKNGQNILLKTSGGKKNTYLYTKDAVSALLLLLVRGKRGEAYNVGNEATYCSIKEMGEKMAAALGNGNIRVLVNIASDTSQYRPEGYLNLDVSKLMQLGWTPTVGLADMFHRTCME